MNILVIDNEPHIRRTLQMGLEGNSYQVHLAATGEEGLNLAVQRSADLVILDVSLPGMDGFEVCRQLRKWSRIPIVILSERNEERDKILALDAGADDYLTKPFKLGELLARLRAVLRRTHADEALESVVFSAGPLQIDLLQRQVYVSDRKVHFTPTEYELLVYMVQHPNRVLTHRHLLTQVWGDGYAHDTCTLRVHIANVRHKIEADAAHPRFLHTKPRIGYCFRVDDTN